MARPIADRIRSERTRIVGMLEATNSDKTLYECRRDVAQIEAVFTLATTLATINDTLEHILYRMAGKGF